MADHERNDLRREVERTRQVLEANELRRTLLHQRERPHGVRGVGAALGSWVRGHSVRLVAAAAFVLLGTAGFVASSSMTEDEPQRLPNTALPESGQVERPAKVTVTLSMADSGNDEESDAEPPEDSSGAAVDEEPSEEPGASQAADDDVPEDSPSPEQEPRATTRTSAEPDPDPTPSDPPPEPELSDTADTGDTGDTGDTDDAPADERGPADSPEPEGPDEDADTAEETCLGVDLLVLSVDLCL